MSRRSKRTFWASAATCSRPGPSALGPLHSNNSPYHHRCYYHYHHKQLKPDEIPIDLDIKYMSAKDWKNV